MHAGPNVEVPGKITKAVLNQIDDVAVNLHGIDLAGAVIKRLQYITTRPCPQHQHMRLIVRLFQHMIRQRRGKLVKIGQRREIAVKSRDYRWTVSVHEHRQLRRRFIRGVEAHSRRMTEGNAAAFHYRNLPEGTGSFLDHPHPGNIQGLAQILVGGGMH